MGSIPVQLNRRFKWNTEETTGKDKSKIIKLLLGLGGGVLLSTTFLHMLPEVIEEAAKKIQQDNALDKDFGKDDDCENNLVEATEGCALGHVHRGHSHGYGHGHTHIPAAPTTDGTHELIISSLKGLLIVLGLSVHELFEGLAIGLEGAASHVWYMFAAVSAHKFVIAFCIGVELVASKTNQCLSMIYICTFAIVSPLGIGIGMLLIGGDVPAANGPLPVILQGIATGTLLYVVFFEILHHNRDGLHQYLAILIGFLLMSGLQLAIPHHHSHGGGNEHHHGHSHIG
ncbi:zinc transporter ZIP1-like [Epargyreus clarus]|uniref:zinc transporter ZIP1-like n=1 Tax=Epargyreus clarus TaxID=520877 RepID=UPI003C2F815E